MTLPRHTTTNPARVPQGTSPQVSALCEHQRRPVDRVQGWPATRHALTTSETLLTLAIATTLLITGLWTAETYADQLREARNQQILTSLGIAIERYERTTGQHLPGPASIAMTQLTQLEDIRPVIANLPVRVDPNGRVTPLDAYNNPLAYLETSQGAMSVSDFVSAGPDGRFGDAYSDDPAKISALIDDQYASDFELIF
ncbi:MAG: hypothetical protein RLN76_00745 [Phycisphaeraceae bacterium]